MPFSNYSQDKKVIFAKINKVLLLSLLNPFCSTDLKNAEKSIKKRTKSQFLKYYNRVRKAFKRTSTTFT